MVRIRMGINWIGVKTVLCTTLILKYKVSGFLGSASFLQLEDYWFNPQVALNYFVAVEYSL